MSDLATPTEPKALPKRITGNARSSAQAGNPAATAKAAVDAAKAKAGAAAGSAGPSALHLIRVEGEVRRCESREALWQHLANEPVALLPFRQAVVLQAHGKVVVPGRKLRAAKPAQQEETSWKTVAVSGLTRVNRDAPMTRWYEHIVDSIWQQGEAARKTQTFELPTHADLADPCTAEASLRHMLWVPLADGKRPVRAGWLLARDVKWEEAHCQLATRLAEAYAHGLSAIDGREKPPAAWRKHQSKFALAAVAAVAALVFVHVPLTTLAPVEVTPQDPLVVAAPVRGVVERILVAPGAQVSKGTPLVQLVDTNLRSDYDVANQKREVARAKVLRLQQAAVDDTTAKHELAIAQTEETVAAAELDYAKAMLDKSIIRAGQNGVALYGDPRDWAGRPVAVGEAIMRVADPKLVEYQIKVPVADAVNVHENARIKVFLDAAPMAPLDAHVVRAAYKAEPDATGKANFTVTARVDDANAPAERLGLRGTARVYGEPVSLVYYLLRRPITALRQWSGV